MVGGEQGTIDLYNIEREYKQFTTVQAYIKAPVNYLLSTGNMVSGIANSFLTFSNDGMISVWEWKKP